jgi:hypothetical protein
MAGITVFVRHADAVLEFAAFDDTLVGRFYNEHLKNRADLAPIADKRLYRERDGEVVVAGDELQFYKDRRDAKTVSFILQSPPIAPSAAVAAGAPSAAIATSIAMAKRAMVTDILLARGIAAKKEVLTRAFVAFGTELENALKFNAEDGIVETYNKAKQCPGSTTLAEFQREGYQPIGILDSKSPIITVVHEGLPFVVKPLKDEEIERQRILDARIRALGGHAAVGGVWIAPDAPESLPPFRLVDYNDKSYLITPCYGTALSKCGAFPATVVSIFFRNIIKVLRFLHGLGLAYCDLKPDNVCLKGDGNCILVDLGSIAQFGEPAMTTIGFLPVDMAHPPFVASEGLDYWLFAMFVWSISGLEPVKDAAGNIVRSRSASPKRAGKSKPQRLTDERTPAAVTREALLACLLSDVHDGFLDKVVYEELLLCLRPYMA